MENKTTKNELHSSLVEEIDKIKLVEEKTVANEQNIEMIKQEVVAHKAEKATDTTLGHVMVDGDTIVVDENGVISISDPLTLSNVLNFSGTNAAQAVYLSWDNPVSNDFLGVTLFRSTQDISNSTYEYCVANATQLVNGTDTSYDDIDMSPGTYYYRIFARYDVFGKIKRSEGIGLSANAVEWDGYYYNLGEEYLSITGGWIEGYSQGEAGKISKETDHLHLYTDNITNVSTYVTANLIDLTNISTLYIDMELSSDYVLGYGKLIVDDLQQGSYAQYDALLDKTGTLARAVYSLNVSSLTGSYYLRLHARDGNGNNVTNTNFKNI